MKLDDELCLCFHVTKRKVLNFLRVENPRRAGQLSECFGAGTGCGWCRPYLERLFQQHQQGVAGNVAESDSPDSNSTDRDLPDRTSYAQGRADYVRKGGGVPPAGATPLPPPSQET